MEAIGYGFLLGIGILLAGLAFAAVIGLAALAFLFISYMGGKKGKGDAGKQRVENAGESWIRE